MKFGQVIEWKMRNISLKKSYTNLWWRNCSQTLSDKIKVEHITGSTVKSFIQFVYIVCKVEGF